MIEQGRWPREQQSFWEEMRDNVDNIRYLEFTGGEPFMIKEHFNFLETLVEKGVAGNIEIHYNTNGTKFPDAKAIWKHFKLVEIAFSIDDVDERFEYQRKNAHWSEVNENIGKFKELKQELGNIVLQVCSTVNVFNVLYLEKLSHWIDEQDFDFVYWNMLHEIEYNCVANMCDELKALAVDTLEQIPQTNKHKKEFNRVITFINQGKRNHSTRELLANIKKFDNIRAEVLSDHHQELAEAIGYET